jgi:hypothetical protein
VSTFMFELLVVGGGGGGQRFTIVLGSI